MAKTDVPVLPHVTVRPVEPMIGAEIDGIALATASDAERDLIHKALLRYKVIFFRDQKMTRAEHVAFGRRFGELEVHPLSAHPEYPEMLVLESIGEHREGIKAPAANFWHSDTTFRENPSAASVLYAYEIPELGGDTLWSNTAAAYAGLDRHIQDRIENLVAIHTGPAAFWPGLDTPEKRAGFWRNYPPQTHPVVRVHPETGERLLYVNSGFTTRILGVSESESRALLTRLFDEIARPEYQLRFHWRVGSVAMWDNRATQHYGVADYTGRRHLERVTVVGDRPRGPGEGGGSVVA